MERSQRPRRWSRVQAFLTAVALCVSGAAASPPPSDLWVTDSARLGAAILRVEIASGARSLVDLDDYPNVVGLRSGVRAPDGALYLEAVNAAQLSTIVRYDPVAGTVVGISGFVDGESVSPRGSGPDFQPGLRGLVVGPWGRLYALRGHAGPMVVDIATGDRRVVSQSVDPAVGGGIGLGDPLDLVVGRSGSILVADRFAGLVQVSARDGSRRSAFVFPDLIEGPHRIERLPDGRVLHAFGAGDGRRVTAFDPGMRSEVELSGPQRGAGPGFVAVVDLGVGADGTIFVLDLGLPGILVVDPATGDRAVVAEDPTGEDLGLLSTAARLVGSAVVNAPPAPRLPGARLGGSGQPAG